MPSFETPTRTSLNASNPRSIPNEKNLPWDQWNPSQAFSTPSVDSSVSVLNVGSGQSTPAKLRRSLFGNKKQQILNITKQLALLVEKPVLQLLQPVLR